MTKARRAVMAAIALLGAGLGFAGYGVNGQVAYSAENQFSVYSSFNEMAAAPNPVLPPVEALTSGPNFHWFGYYLHDQWDATGRYLLCQQVDFENRLPTPDDAIKIGMIDLEDGNRWIELGESRAWSWQQGAFLQWRPGSATEVVWNDREVNPDGTHKAVSRVYDMATQETRTLPMAIDEAISPDGRYALCSDFSRIWNVRPGYGYPGIENASTNTNIPDDVGVWRMDMDTGDTEFLISLEGLVDLPFNGNVPRDTYHYVNHFDWAPDGERFSMYHRWRGGGTRVYTMAADGSDIRLLSAAGASHWTWRDDEHVVIWGPGDYQLYEDDNSGNPKMQLWQAPNGHESFIPGTNNEWLVTDTYPTGEERLQHVYLIHLPTQRFVPLGRFESEYQGEWRCDTHPRVSRDGQWVVIDSPHGGNGRQQYRINIGEIIASPYPPAPIGEDSPAPYAYTVLGDDPVGYWRLGETAPGSFAEARGREQLLGLHIGLDSGSGPGNVAQSGPRPADGFVGMSPDNRAVHLAGGYDHASVHDTAELDITGTLTLEAWVRLDEIPTGNEGIVSKYVGSGDQRSFALYVDGASDDGTLGLIISPDGTYTNAAVLRDDVPLALDTWLHVVGTYEPSQQMRLYVNGSQVAAMTTGVPEAIFSSTSNLWIGCVYSSSSPDSHFAGLIDEVAVYDRVLSSDEILEHYLAAFSVYGDANRDGRVDDDDASILADHWGETGADWSRGDFNGDGEVNAADASILAANWGYGVDGEGSGTTAPEPSVLLMLLSLLVMYQCCGAGRRRSESDERR